MNNEIEVIYEDKEMLAISKPAGVVVNRAETVKGLTIQDWMEDRYRIFRDLKKSDNLSEQDELFLARSGVAHRLDKDTSGVLALAKSPSALQNLMSQFKQRTLTKTYLALVHGKPSPREGSLRVPLGRLPGRRTKFGVVLGGKMTETSYRVVEEFGVNSKNYQDGFALLELEPKTGRTHQLRVILQHLGYAIVGDIQYVGRKRAKKDRVWCQRHFLHAFRLELTQPVTGENLRLEASLPKDLEQAISWVRGG